MPRVKPQDLFRARAINKLLPLLLPVCRDLSSARNELRWLQEHAVTLSRQTGQFNHTPILRGLIQRRAHGEPLQYLLGSEYFGSLEIKCRPGVLIPRSETATSVAHFVSLLHENDTKSRLSPLRILDLCTGSGCIPLLFHHEYYKDDRKSKLLELVGIDISSDALSLAQENLVYQIANQSKQGNEESPATRSLRGIGFVRANVLQQENNNVHVHDSHSVSEALQRLSRNRIQSVFDIIISNPPYISPNEFRTTPPSVRKYEPRLALVPPAHDGANDDAIAGLFYPRLLEIAVNVRAKVALFEVSDFEQAEQVVALASKQRYWTGLEIWRDYPSGCSSEASIMLPTGQKVRLRGLGHGRSVLLYHEAAAPWLRIIP